ncbi:MAG: hypothetical protein IK068_06810 [Lachnospiraceae bacterium]|nr:hypothetical protein [Lachnospiraceae bacterium]
MSKKVRKLIALSIALIMAIAAVFALSSSRENGSGFENEFDIVDSKVVPEHEAMPGGGEFRADEDTWGYYHVSVSSDKDSGCIVGFCVKDSEGNQVFCITGGEFDADSVMINFKAGETYTEEFVILPSVEAYEEYTRAHFDDAETCEANASWFKDGHYKVKYSVTVRERIKYARQISLVFGVFIGLLLVAIAATAAKKEEVTITYDERQIAMQGKAYKYAFYSMLIYYGLWMLFEAFSVTIPVSKTLLIFLGIVVGLITMLTISVMKDAYFKLNENKTQFVIFFVFMAVFNLAIGVMHIVRGDFIEEGVVTATGSINLLCGILMVYLLLVIFIKKVKDKREEE